MSSMSVEVAGAMNRFKEVGEEEVEWERRMMVVEDGRWRCNQERLSKERWLRVEEWWVTSKFKDDFRRMNEV